MGREIGKGGTKGGGGEGNGITRSIGSPRCRVALLPASSIGGGASVEDKRDEVRPAGGTTEVSRGFVAMSAIYRCCLVALST